MKEEHKNTKNWISFRVKPEEYDEIHRLFKKSSHTKFSQYARQMLMQKPVTLTYRNQSSDDFLQLLTKLFKTLNGIGNNFNQAVKKLHLIKEIPEYKKWYLRWNIDRQILINKIEETKKTTLKIYYDDRNSQQPGQHEKSNEL
ncbi:plasmid mobilization protein [Pedobacter paludis]|uniref:plasmid mobilization protein n=1 Tax=Pedobacter paludis TaxID=2203212 RepID=UPI0019821ED0|nr:plasmid mobilization relaxosome protein MobC [Pedobacter paludis]